jgi:hypothetical protein
MTTDTEVTSTAVIRLGRPFIFTGNNSYIVKELVNARVLFILNSLYMIIIIIIILNVILISILTLFNVTV